MSIDNIYIYIYYNTPMEHELMKGRCDMKKKVLWSIFLVLIISINFLEISIPFINTTNKVEASWGDGYAWYRDILNDCAYCGPFWSGACWKYEIPNTPECD